MSSDCETLPAPPDAPPDDDATIPERVRDHTEADTLRWVPIARKVEPPPDTKRYGSGG